MVPPLLAVLLAVVGVKGMILLDDLFGLQTRRSYLDCSRYSYFYFYSVGDSSLVRAGLGSLTSDDGAIGSDGGNLHVLFCMLLD